jgi:AcrR family transcriptional regulator
MTRQGQELMEQLDRGMDELLPGKGTRQIVLAALDVFARKGLTAARISDIAEKAGFSQGFVYNYFKSKDGIFTKIVDLAAEGAGSAVKKAAVLQGSPYERIYWLTEALLCRESIAMQHWRLILLQTATTETVPEEAKRISREKSHLPFDHMIPLLIEGQRAGEIVPGDPFMLAIAYFSFVQGVAISMVQVSSRIPLPNTEMILSFLRTPDCPASPAKE